MASKDPSRAFWCCAPNEERKDIYVDITPREPQTPIYSPQQVSPLVQPVYPVQNVHPVVYRQPHFVYAGQPAVYS